MRGLFCRAGTFAMGAMGSLGLLGRPWYKKVREVPLGEFVVDHLHLVFILSEVSLNFLLIQLLLEHLILFYLQALYHNEFV